MSADQKGLRKVTAKGLTKIGGGITGSVYRLNEEQALKVYDGSVTFEEVSHLYDVSVFLNKNGIKAAKAFEIVNTDGTYGIIQQYIDGDPLPKRIANGDIARHEAALRMGRLLAKLHDTKPEAGIFPSLEVMFGGILDRCGNRLQPSEKEKAAQAINQLPFGNVLLHGDFHENNIIVKEDAFYLIDLDSVCVGSPLFEFLQIFCVYQNEIPKEMQEALCLRPAEARDFLRTIIEVYFDKKESSFIDQYYDIFSQMGDFNRFLAHFLMASGDGSDELRKYAAENIDKVTNELLTAADACSGLEYRWK